MIDGFPAVLCVPSSKSYLAAVESYVKLPVNSVGGQRMAPNFHAQGGAEMKMKLFGKKTLVAVVGFGFVAVLATAFATRDS